MDHIHHSLVRARDKPTLYYRALYIDPTNKQMVRLATCTQPNTNKRTPFPPMFMKRIEKARQSYMKGITFDSSVNACDFNKDNLFTPVASFFPLITFQIPCNSASIVAVPLFLC